MRKLFLFLLPVFLLFLCPAAWAQSDMSAVYTSNVTLSTTGGTSASTCKVKISETDYNGIKCGITGTAGAMKITIPAGTKYLHVHIAGWNGENVTVSITPDTYSSTASISLTSDAGISGTGSTYTLSGTLSDYYKVITFTTPLASNTEFTFSATSGKRFVIWGVNSELQCFAPVFSIPEGLVENNTIVAISSSTAGSTIYYTTDGSTPTTSNYTAKGSDEAASASVTISAETTVKAIAVKEGIITSDVSSAVYSPTADPFILLSSTSVDETTAEADGSISVRYGNIDIIIADVLLCASDGVTPASYDWLIATIDNENNLSYLLSENTTNDSRTAYVKVYALDNSGENYVYSNLLTITQAGTGRDFAYLPFEFNGGRDDIASTIGLTQHGLGTDYSDNDCKLKFDGTGDYVILKINEAPGVLMFKVKGGSFSGGTFVLETSTDGDTYTNKATIDVSTLTHTISDLGENDRYIKWKYASKSSGNVGLGSIKMDPKYVEGIISAAGWSTFSNSYKLDLSTISSGTAYVASDASESVVTLTPCTNIVAANTGLMIKGTAGQTFRINTTTDAATSPAATNLLVGQSSTGTVAASTSGVYHYVFSYSKADASVYGFYNLTVATEIPAGKAYLETTTELTPAGAPAIIRIVDEENNTTSIERIDGKNDAIKFIENGKLYILRDGVVYDALGRMVK